MNLDAQIRIPSRVNYTALGSLPVKPALRNDLPAYVTISWSELHIPVKKLNGALHGGAEVV